MNDSIALAAVMPAALGIAISPTAIIMAILVLLSPRARVAGPAFLLGWILGVGASLYAFTVLGSVEVEVDGQEVDHALRTGILDLALAAILIVLTFQQWGKRPKPGQEAKLPAWMAKASGLGPASAAGVALLLAVVMPKNLILSASSGATLAAAEPHHVWLVGLFFGIIASWCIALPVLAALAARERAAAPLEKLRAWLTQYNTVIMALVLGLLAVVLLGKGVAALAHAIF